MRESCLVPGISVLHLHIGSTLSPKLWLMKNLHVILDPEMAAGISTPLYLCLAQSIQFSLVFDGFQNCVYIPLHFSC